MGILLLPLLHLITFYPFSRSKSMYLTFALHLIISAAYLKYNGAHNTGKTYQMILWHSFNLWGGGEGGGGLLAINQSVACVKAMGITWYIIKSLKGSSIFKVLKSHPSKDSRWTYKYLSLIPLWIWEYSVACFWLLCILIFKIKCLYLGPNNLKSGQLGWSG